ncbi:DUF3617 domain-containing protein [Undibacterium sp. Di24W]|uniref:DUF3617 domain-containing protein n=1 Tax=Undibacterium sp. Di24W TaxID=3413033 RepID=UPI003BF1F721
MKHYNPASSASTCRQIAMSIALCAMALTANAQEKMKPGLWEMTVRSDMLKSMPAIPPAQLEELKKRGIKMPAMGNGAAIQKMCVTAEMTDKVGKNPLQNNPGDCKEKSSSRTGNTSTVEMVCDGPRLKGTGIVKATYSDKSLQSVYDFKGESNNRPVNQHIETTGKWLSADCGDIKPYAAVPKK